MTMPRRVFVTTVPFGTIDDTPLRLLAAASVDVVINPLNRRLRPEEIAPLIRDFPVVIAGTETYPREALDACPQLRAICRVGIGLDGVPLSHCEKRGVAVSYTPDAPSPAVAELSVGLMLDLLRGISTADRRLRTGEWQRVTGRRLSAMKVGIVGVGRIGRRVIDHLQGGFPGVRILAHDLVPQTGLPGVEWVGLDRLMAESDIVTLHLPLSPATRHIIGAAELNAMRKDALLINTARGGIVDEAALAVALRDGRLRAAAVDVFEEEPYTGPLATIDNIVLTCHMGSMTADCRARMEIEATEEAIRILDGVPLLSAVPDSEYAMDRQRHLTV